MKHLTNEEIEQIVEIEINGELESYSGSAEDTLFLLSIIRKYILGGQK